MTGPGPVSPSSSGIATPALLPAGHFQPERARLLVSVTTSADGRIALNRSGVLMDPEAADIWRSLHPAGAKRLIAERGQAIESSFQPEAILEGSGTFVTESADPPPALPAAGTDAATLLNDHVPGTTDCRWFVVVDSRGRIRWTITGEGSTRLLVLVSRTTPLAYLAYLRREEIPYLVTGQERVDLRLALQRLKSRLGVQWVVSQAGGGLNGALLRAGLVDEVHLVLLPALIGGRDTPAIFDGPSLGTGESGVLLRLLASATTDDGAVWLHYAVDGSADEAVSSPTTG